MTAYALFSTSIGRCALAWHDQAIAGAALGGADDGATVRAISRGVRSEADPPAWVQDVIARVRRLFDGEPISFADVPLLLNDASPFERLVYRETLAIAHGETRTYGEIARAVGQAGAARAVGRALGRNPIPIIIPCHRVLAADGRSGGFSAPGGIATKLRLLDIERARRGAQPDLFGTLVWTARS